MRVPSSLLAQLGPSPSTRVPSRTGRHSRPQGFGTVPSPRRSLQMGRPSGTGRYTPTILPQSTTRTTTRWLVSLLGGGIHTPKCSSAFLLFRGSSPSTAMMVRQKRLALSGRRLGGGTLPRGHRSSWRRKRHHISPSDPPPS